MGSREKTAKEQAFRELFVQNYSLLYYAALYIVNDEAEARDIVSDYLTTLWESYSPETTTYTKQYLQNGVRRRCIDYLKHLKVKNKYTKLYLALHKEYDPSRETEDRLAVIERVMETMPEKTRTIFEMCYFENKRYNEVAELVGLSRNGVRKNIMKGLSMLREAFSVTYKKGQAARTPKTTNE